MELQEPIHTHVTAKSSDLSESRTIDDLATTVTAIATKLSMADGEHSGSNAEDDQVDEGREKDHQNSAITKDDDRSPDASDMETALVRHSNAISPGSPSEATNFSQTPSCSSLEDGKTTQMARDSVSDRASLEASSPPRSSHANQESRSVEVGALQRLEDILQRLEILAEELSSSSNFVDVESDDESQLSLCSSADTLCDRDERSLNSDAVEPLTHYTSNGPVDGADAANNSNWALPPSENTHCNGDSSGSGIGSKRPLSLSGGDGSDEADDDRAKRPRKSPDSSNPDLDQRTYDGRDQIPCFIDDCPGKDAYISELM
jgi:hypothetical protein